MESSQETKWQECPNQNKKLTEKKKKNQPVRAARERNLTRAAML
jgi:hypothetical protein